MGGGAGVVKEKHAPRPKGTSSTLTRAGGLMTRGGTSRSNLFRRSHKSRGKKKKEVPRGPRCRGGNPAEGIGLSKGQRTGEKSALVQ